MFVINITMNQKKENNQKYQYGKIYALVEDKKKIIYIGSTIQKLVNRFLEHIVCVFCEDDPKYYWKLYKYIRKIGINRIKIVLIEKYPCDNEESLKKYEYEYINSAEPIFNFIKSYEEEMRIFNKNKIC